MAAPKKAAAARGSTLSLSAPVPSDVFEKYQVAGRQSGPAFSSFLERDALREKRRKSRRNTLIVSLVVHGIALGGLLVYSLWDVDQLWGPSVKVKVYSQKAVPAAVAAPAPPAPSPPPSR
jgi:hypothetical protein